MAEALESLRAMFPDASTEVLEQVLLAAGGDAGVAANLLFGDEDAGEGGGDGGGGGGDGPGGPAGHDEAGAGALGDGDDEDDEVEDDDGEEAEDDEEDEEEHQSKRLRTVEATPAEELAGRKSNLVQFDQAVLRKTYMQLLNLTLSKLSHTSVTIWSDDVADQKAAQAMVEGDKGGWWIQHFPVSEVDHVWRLLVSAHLTSKSLGSVVHVTGSSFRLDAGGDFEVRLLVRDMDEVSELKRIGAGLLSVAAGSGGVREYIFFLRSPLTPGQRESKTRLEELSHFKLTKERLTEPATKRPGKPFAFQDP